MPLSHICESKHLPPLFSLWGKQIWVKELERRAVLDKYFGGALTFVPQKSMLHFWLTTPNSKILFRSLAYISNHTSTIFICHFLLEVHKRIGICLKHASMIFWVHQIDIHIDPLKNLNSNGLQLAGASETTFRVLIHWKLKYF